MVGKRLRKARMLKGLTLEKLAAQLDLSHQQIQKYEKGENTIRLDRLLAMAGILGVAVGHFPEDVEAADSGACE
jgi:transcriptional regulator with XRE-family HTH domain